MTSWCVNNLVLTVRVPIRSQKDVPLCGHQLPCKLLRVKKRDTGDVCDTVTMAVYSI